MRNTVVPLLATLVPTSSLADPSLAARVAQLEANVQAQQLRIDALRAQAHEAYTDADAVLAVDPHQIISTFFSRTGYAQTDIAIMGANLHIRNGLSDTGATPNGLGNLIIGYNEDAAVPLDRSGSHNLVIGSLNSYSSYGGLVAGSENQITAPFASVSGGLRNRATYWHASVSGGAENLASGRHSSVSGGGNSTASGDTSSVSGGLWNVASGFNASVTSGVFNTASGEKSTVTGGRENTAGGQNSSVSGGLGITTTSQYEHPNTH